MKQVVVIGGGFAGSYIAKKLESKFNVTLIDSKDYFEFTPGILRTIVEPEHMQKIQALHSSYLKKATVVVGDVKEVGKDYVIVNSEMDKKIKFDYLAICSGSRYNLPIKEKGVIITTRANHLVSANTSLKNAKNVLMIGGGLVGVELAAEIITKYPDKKVTIVHAQDKLIERNPQKAVNYAEKFLKQRGVNIVYTERISSMGKSNCVFKTNKGRTIYADLAFWCTGIAPNFEFLSKKMKTTLGDRNSVKVNNYLQLNGYKNIFAAGDVTDILEEKTAQNAEKHARIVVANICALESGKDLRKYKSNVTPLVISLGKYHGILVYGKLVLTCIIPGIMKGIIEKREMMRYRQ